MKRLRKMSGVGDETVAEWSEATSLDRLAEIENEFNELTAKGYFAANLETNEIIRKFDPSANILMLPAMAGGSGR